MISDSSRKETLKQINELLRQAEEEERKYNWKNEIEILKKAEKISLNKKLKEIEGEIYYKLGEIYQISADFEKTDEKVLKSYQLSISNFQRACNSFKNLKNEKKINASLGFINYLKYILGSEEGKEEILLESAKNYYKKAKLIYSKNGNLTDSLKMAIFESRALNLLFAEKLIRIDENTDPIEMASECENIIKTIWEELKNKQDFSELYLGYFLISIMEFSNWILSLFPAEDLINKQYIIDNRKMIEEFINIFQKPLKILCAFMSYSLYSWFYNVLALYFVDNQFERKKYLKTAQKWLTKGEIFLPKINHNSALAFFYYMRFCNAIYLIYLGYFAKDFKNIISDVNSFTELILISNPKILAVYGLFYTAGIFTIATLNRSTPDIQRIDFAKKAHNLIELATNKLLIVTNPNYKLFNLLRDGNLCPINATLGDLIKDKKASFNYLQTALKIFDKTSDYSNQKIDNTFAYLLFLGGTSRAGILLAENSSIKSEKINSYQKTLSLLLKSKKIIVAIFHIENLFLIGDTYYELGRLTNDDKILKKSYLSYMDAIEYCKNKGYFNLVGSGYINLAKIEDRLGNFLSAAENYKNAINSFDQAILTLTYTKLSKKIEKLKNYIHAWNIIEVAKSYHAKEDHYNAELNYEEASQILNNVREYKFEAPFYAAWSILENAEDLSKKNKHQEAAASYLVSKSKFQIATEILNSYISKRKSPEDIDRISKLIQVAKVRETYCTARHQIETARLESKKGNFLVAAELYSKASSLFEKLCQTFSIKREKDELMAIFYLCKAWEKMERAEVKQKASLYSLASKLFEKASKTFPESRMKKLSLGNSLYCSALECGTLFDETIEIGEKLNYYRKIKLYLRESSKNYKLGGFEQDSQWALATSTFFDGIWHLIQSDYEVDHSKKNQYLNIATNYLNNALEIYGNAGYVQRREEILKYLKMIKDEKAILTSALNLIEKPAISASSVGISAPSCPAEISSSVNIEEMQRTDLQTESELNWRKRIHYIYLILPNGTCIFDHSFKVEKDIEPHLVAGGLTGISMLIQEVTKDKTKIKIVEQEEMTILLEHGKYLSVALITEENLMTLRNKLAKLIQEVENFYQEELEAYSGDISVFPKISRFIQMIFEK
ncbi:MAG: hypothetical protein HWN67_16145 [Candidatus Helarchaeota archaeon]|nr:hypothetical protein [Candidatus Helarchaeota archaeon]